MQIKVFMDSKPISRAKCSTPAVAKRQYEASDSNETKILHEIVRLHFHDDHVRLLRELRMYWPCNNFVKSSVDFMQGISERWITRSSRIKSVKHIYVYLSHDVLFWTLWLHSVWISFKSPCRKHKLKTPMSFWLFHLTPDVNCASVAARYLCTLVIVVCFVHHGWRANRTKFHSMIHWICWIQLYPRRRTHVKSTL